jgi:hypothetical protein
MDMHEQDCDGKFEREGDVFDEIPSGVLEGKETDFRVADVTAYIYLALFVLSYYGMFLYYSYSIS